MKSRIWTGCVLAAVFSTAAAARGDDRPAPSAPEASASAVCLREKRTLEATRRERRTEHPDVAAAAARVEAACRPAPTAGCATARADLAGLRRKYLDRHPDVIAAQTRAEALCAPAPSPACAEARADLAEAKARYLEKHPKLQAAQKTAAHACASPAATPARKPPPR